MTFSKNLFPFLLICLLAGCGQSKCKPEGFEADILKEIGMYADDEVRGAMPRGTFTTALTDVHFIKSENERNICEATISLQGTIGEEWRGIRPVMIREWNKGSNEYLAALKYQLEQKKNLDDIGYEIRGIADKPMDVKGNVSYAISKETKHLIAVEHGDASIIMAWLNKVEAIGKADLEEKQTAEKTLKDQEAIKAGYKSARHMQIAKQLEALKLEEEAAQKKSQEAQAQVESARQRREALKKALSQSSFGDGSGLIAFDNIRLEVRPKPFYPDDPVYWIVATGHQLGKSAANSVGYDAILYSPTAGFLHVTDGSLNLGAGNSWKAEDSFAGYATSRLECCGKEKILFSNRDWRIFLHVISAYRTGAPHVTFPKLNSPDQEVEELIKAAIPLQIEWGTITKKIQVMQQQLDQEERSH